MLRLTGAIAIAAASGVFLAVPPLAAHAAVAGSYCTFSGVNGLFCQLYESRGGAPSELSDVVPLTETFANSTIALVENPALPQTDPRNWSDVVVFVYSGGSNGAVHQLSEGCGNPNDPFDISCFPPATAVSQFVAETQQGQGNDFSDCTTFRASSNGSASVIACSDAAVSEAPEQPDIPEVPLPILLPSAALGMVAVVGFRKLLTRTT